MPARLISEWENSDARHHITSYHESLIKSLKDPDEAFAYLQVAQKEYDIDGDHQAFMIALQNLDEAKKDL